jgi:hypothetical protein
MEAIEGTGAEYVNEDGTTADEEKAGDLKAAKDAVKPADKDRKIIKNIVIDTCIQESDDGRNEQQQSHDQYHKS